MVGEQETKLKFPFEHVSVILTLCQDMRVRVNTSNNSTLKTLLGYIILHVILILIGVIIITASLIIDIRNILGRNYYR